jgi:hypothetical protein
MRALKELLLRGAVTVLICALVALGVAGLFVTDSYKFSAKEAGRCRNGCSHGQLQA